MIGKTIRHYKILEKLGEGGMGVVYKAEDTKLERTVALKFLSLASIGDEEKKRFKREAKAAASLNHPNIATIFAIDEVDDQTFIAMEFIEGRSLQHLINSPLEGGAALAAGVLAVPYDWTWPSTTPPKLPPVCKPPMKKASPTGISKAPTSW